MKCKTCKIGLVPPYYITCDVCGRQSCMTHGIQLPEGFACCEEHAKIVNGWTDYKEEEEE